MITVKNKYTYPAGKYLYHEALDSVMCDVIKIHILSISFLGVLFPTSSLKTYFYNVTHDTFQRFKLSYIKDCFDIFSFMIETSVKIKTIGHKTHTHTQTHTHTTHTNTHFIIISHDQFITARIALLKVVGAINKLFLVIDTLLKAKL